MKELVMFILRGEVERALETGALAESRRRTARWVRRTGGASLANLDEAGLQRIVGGVYEEGASMSLRSEFELAHAALARALVADRGTDSPAKAAVELALHDGVAMAEVRVVMAVELARSAAAIDAPETGEAHG